MLTNREYIAFSRKNTVEVMCMQDLERALAEKNPQVKTYQAKDRYGDEVEYLVKFPGLTVEHIRELAEGKPLEYMEGKLMPATVIVDPHSLEKMGGLPRSVRSASGFIKAITPHVKALKVKYGKGVDRGLWNTIDECEIEIDLLLGEGKIPEALAVYRLIAKRAVRQPEVVKTRVESCREVILDDAKKKLDEFEKKINDGAGKTVARELKRLARALADTPLETRANALTARSQKKS